LSRHHQHLKQRIENAKQVLEQQRRQEYLVTLVSLVKMLLVSAETALSNEDYPLLIKLSQQIANNFKLIRTLQVEVPDFSCYHLLTSPDWPIHGTVISDNEDFYEEERRAIARNFSRPCDDLDQPAACEPLAQAASLSPSTAEASRPASSPAAPAADPAASITTQSSAAPNAPPKASGMEVGRNREASGRQPGQNRHTSGIKPGQKRADSGKQPDYNRNPETPRDSRQTAFPGLLPEILDLLPPSQLSKLYIDDPEGRFQRFLPRDPGVLKEGSLTGS
jgi:hypothetical protein